MKVYVLLISSMSNLLIDSIFSTQELAEQKKQEILNQNKFSDSEINILEYVIIE